MFTACRQYTVDIEEYLSYWASEPYVKDHTVKTVHHNDGESILCVPSASNITVTLTLYNPKHFPFVMPTPKDADNTENNKNIIHFPGLDKQPQCGTDYTLQQTAPETLQLVYKSAFLQTHEWGNGDIGPEIILKAQDGRPFKQKYSFKIRANTSPQKPNFTVAKTKGSSAYYVLCIAARDMDQKVPGGLVHKDLTRIEINGTPYGLSINEGQTAFIKPESGVFIAHSEVEKLSDPNADDIPSGGWVLYYKTDVEVKEGTAKKDYTIRLADAKGLVSEALNASTKPNRPESETLTITKGAESGSASGSISDPKIIGADGTGAELRVSSATGNTLVHCTLTDMGSGAAAEYTGNPATVPLALNGEGTKTYKLDYYTDGEGFTATPVKTVYYKVLQKYTVTFDTKEGTPVPPQQFVLHGDKVSKPASPARTGYTFGEWYKDAACSSGQEWNFTTDMVTSNITLYAKWDAGTGTGYRVEHYQERPINPAGQYLSTPTTIETPSGTTGTVLSIGNGITRKWNESDGFEFDRLDPASPVIAGEGNTVVKVYYKRKTVTLTFNPNGGTINGAIANATRSGRFGTGFSPVIPVRDNYTFDSWNPTITTTFPKNDVTYTAQWNENPQITFKVEDGTGGSLKCSYTDGNGTSQNRTANDSTGQTVRIRYNSNITFTASPTNTNWQVAEWTCSSGSLSGSATGGSRTLSNITSNTTVTVKFYKSTISTGAYAWRDLRRAIKAAPAGATLTISGEIKASGDGSGETANQGELKITKNLTIKGTNSASDILNADTKNRIFDVESGCELTLEHLTLKNGKKQGASGGGIYSDGGTLNLKNTNIENCTAGQGGAIRSNGKVTLDNVTIGGSSGKANKASKKGGGIYLTGNRARCETRNSTISHNQAQGTTPTPQGGGIYIGTSSTVVLENSTVKQCTAGQGGGVYVENGSSFEMKGSSVIEVDAKDEATGDKNAVYLENNAKIKLTGHVGDNKMAARIIPQSYTERQVLTGAIISSAPENYLRVMVKPHNHTYWVVDNAGKLNSTPDKIFEYLSTPAIKAYEPLMKPDVISNRAQLVNKILVYKTSFNNYGIMYITQVDDTIPGFIKFNYKTRDNDNRVIKEESGRTVNGTYIFDLDTGTEPASGDPTHIADFWLQNGGSASFNPENSARFYLIP